MCVILINISLYRTYCCGLLSCLLLLEVTKHMCCRIAVILTPAWNLLLRFHFPVEKCFLVSPQEKRSLNLCGWFRIEGCVLLNYITSSCCLKEGKKTIYSYWKASLSSIWYLCNFFTSWNVLSHSYLSHPMCFLLCLLAEKAVCETCSLCKAFL